MVAMYSSRRLVDHEGESRSMEPLSGSERSMLVLLSTHETDLMFDSETHMVYMPALLNVLIQPSWLREELTL
jgi:hypothetical protein